MKWEACNFMQGKPQTWILNVDEVRAGDTIKFEVQLQRTSKPHQWRLYCLFGLLDTVLLGEFSVEEAQVRAVLVVKACFETTALVLKDFLKEVNK